jgi:thiamine biosynthesis protein ThiS
MRVTVNGKTLEVRAGLTVTALLGELRLAPGPVAVEINRAIVVRAEHARHELQDGDEVEIVSFGRGE